MRSAILAAAALMTLALGGARAEEEPNAFLDRLVGCWRLDGQMGEVVLRQDVEARRTLGGRFVEMRFVQADAPPAGRQRYEALYLIGYDPGVHRYVLNLFDTFGVSADPEPGVGVRSGDEIQFVFLYAEGAFYNTFTLADGTWRMRLEQRQPDGSLHLFAEKRLSPC